VLPIAANSARDRVIASAQGIGLVAPRPKGGEEVVYSFPEAALPTGEVERFTALFNHRIDWTFAEIEPYIK